MMDTERYEHHWNSFSVSMPDVPKWIIVTPSELADYFPLHIHHPCGGFESSLELVCSKYDIIDTLG